MQNSFSCMFISILYMFRAPMCPSSGVSYQYDIQYMSLYVDDRLVCIPDGHLHRVTYIRCHIDTIDSPDDEHMGARNMQRSEINVYEKEACIKLVIYKNQCFFLLTHCVLLFCLSQHVQVKIVRQVSCKSLPYHVDLMVPYSFGIFRTGRGSSVLPSLGTFLVFRVQVEFIHLLAPEFYFQISAHPVCKM